MSQEVCTIEGVNPFLGSTLNLRSGNELPSDGDEISWQVGSQVSSIV